MSFNGVTKDYVTTLRGKKRPPWAPIRRNLMEIQGMPGAYHESTDVEPRPLEVPIVIESKNLPHLQKLKEDLAGWLITDEPKELIFDDEPDRTYYAMVDGEMDVEEIIRVGAGIIKFICPDPYKYGQVQQASYDEFALLEPIVLNNNGKVDTPPKFDITLKAPTTHIDIIGDDDYMRLGRPVNVDEYAGAPETRVLWDEMSTITGWLDTTFKPDGIVQAQGSIKSNGYSISPATLGTSTTNWHGPVKMKTLPEALTDFRIDLSAIIQNPDYKMMGRVEIYLLDENMNVAGKMAILDKSTASDGNYVELRAGDVNDNHFIVNERGDYWTTWLNFDGILRLSRVGNKWSAYVAKIKNGVHDARRTREWIDLETKYTRKVKHIVMHFGAHTTKPVSPMFMTDLKVFKVNSLSGTTIPYIGEAGDKFTIDMKRSLILKNEEPFTKKDFGARFFNLQPGDNAYVIGPSEAVDTVGVEWRSRYR